ncbi:MAG: glycoside hydrolase family 44 protein [Bacillota bacterium]
MKRRYLNILKIILLVSLLHITFFCAAADTVEIEKTIFDDNLAQYWDDWSWANVDLSEDNTVYLGDGSIAVTFSEYSGLYLHSDIDYSPERYHTLRFYIHGGSDINQPIKVKITDASGEPKNNDIKIIAEANKWKEINISLEEIGIDRVFRHILFQEAAGKSNNTIYIDNIQLIGEKPIIIDEPVNGPDLSIDVTEDRYEISPDIYGINYYGTDDNREQLYEEVKPTVMRWGGNSTSRYNWKIDTRNTGNDWYFENLPYENKKPELLPDGSTVNKLIVQNKQHEVKSIITIPMMGRLPMRRKEGKPTDSSFSVTKYGEQQETDPWDPNAGNGIKSDGSYVKNDPDDISIQVGPEYMQEWVSYLNEKFGTADNGGVKLFSLDNEPELWHSTHRDIHPEKITYQELLDKTIEYSSAIKEIDPDILTLGPVSGLYTGDSEEERSKYDGMMLAEWYLSKLHEYEKNNGIRLLDYFDVHYYPATPDIKFSAAGNEEKQEIRLRITRSLWDPTYYDESYKNKVLRIIPRMRELVSEYYPGTKLAITEYNFGAADHINGALTQADVLGIFGREGLDLATLWSPPEPDQPLAYAFKMYSNYDGENSKFGNLGVKAESTDDSRISIYSAIRDSDGALTIMVINKEKYDQECTLDLTGFTPGGNTEVYRYSEEKPEQISREDDISISGYRFNSVFPEQSITLFVIPDGNSANNSIIGDLNIDGSVNSIDIAIIRRHLIGREVDINLNNADIDNSSDVNSLDYASLRRYLLENIDN